MTKTKSIICAVTNDLSYDQRMIRICTALAEAGYAVALVGRSRPASRPLLAMPFAQHRLACYFERGKLFYLEYNLRLLLYLLWRPFDALCAVDLDTMLPCLWAARLRGKPWVYDAHEYFTEVPELVRRPRVQAVWARVASYGIPRARAAYTVGPALAELLTARYGRPFGVVRNVPVAGPAPAEGAGSKIILYQGALNEGRGLEQAIAAMAMLPDAELHLAGEGDLSAALRQLVVRLGLSGRVKFLGYIAPHDLPELTRRARIGINLLENKGLSYYYSLANKAFDYVQAGLPSLQMDFPEYRRLNAEHEVFVLLDVLEQPMIAARLRQLLDNPLLYSALHRNCLAARKAWVWDSDREVLLAIWRDVLEKQ